MANQSVDKRNIRTLTIDLDCSDALKGLKAVQREARKATQALKELEKQQKKNMTLPTKGLKPLSIIVDEMHGVCPECRDYITTENLYAYGEEKPLKQFHHCTDCRWSE